MTLNRHLYQYHKQIQGLRGNVIELLLKGRINEFYKNNGVRVNTLIEKMASLQKDYYIYEGEQIKTEEKDGKKVFVFQDGKTQEQFNAALENLMNQPTTIKI